MNKIFSKKIGEALPNSTNEILEAMNNNLKSIDKSFRLNILIMLLVVTVVIGATTLLILHV